MKNLNVLYYRSAGNLECFDAPDGCVVYDYTGTRVTFLNFTATAIFRLCDGQRTSNDIAAVLQQAFGLQAPPLEQVDTCIQTLSSNGILKLCPNSLREE